jgi:N-methylhydantoinase A
MSAATRVGVDVGGTFTDLVAIRNGEFATAKVVSVPGDQSSGVIEAFDRSGVPSSEIASIAHGTTVGTNALLERRGARTALVTTEGFRDVIEIGRQNRVALYELTAASPPPLVPRELRFTVSERVGPEGVRLAIDEKSLDAAVAALRSEGAEAVAICLLFAFQDPSHEKRVRAAVAEALPDAFVTTSSEVLPEFREYERFSTTAAGAYLGPVIASYLDRLSARLDAAGLPRALVMQSSGGVVDLETAARLPSTCVLSGPAAGVVAAAYAGSESGYSDLLTFDMGGTSTDVGLVLGGQVQVTTGSVVAGVPIRHPLVDVHTVSAGGGSVAWVDDGGALHVGPRSAGAAPGPACYGMGGTEATVTDANLFLGYLEDGSVLGGKVVLDRSAAEVAIGKLATELGVEPVAAADGVLAVAEIEMTRALRVLSVERGIDPRGLTLVAFGGAGGMHACRLADELQIGRILVPQAAGVLSALGLAVADLRRDYVLSFARATADLADTDLDRAFATLESRARNDLAEPQLRRQADVRYHGQSFELTVPASSVAELTGSFHALHEERYGYRSSDAALELVALRLTASTPRPKPALRAHRSAGGAPATRRQCHFDDGWEEAIVFQPASLGVGEVVAGPAIATFPEATCVVRPGWAAFVDPAGALVLERR